MHQDRCRYPYGYVIDRNFLNASYTIVDLQITISCVLEDDVDANFLALLRNGDSDGVTYSAVAAGIGGTGTVLTAASQAALLSDQCDCHRANTCDGLVPH